MEPGAVFIIVFLVGTIGLVSWVLYAVLSGSPQGHESADSESAANRSEPPDREPPAPRSQTIWIDYERVHDLRHLDSVTLRIRGACAYINFTERHAHHGTDYLLVREPRNRHDKNAIAVVYDGRLVGYVTAARAAAIAPLLDQIDADAFHVNGEPTNTDSYKMLVCVPKVPELRAHLKCMNQP